MTGIDTSSLIPLALEDHTEHEMTTLLVGGLLRSPETRIVVAPLVLSEFVHAVSDPKRFEHPLSVSDAIEWLTDFISLPQVVLLMPELPAIFRWLQWMRVYRLGRKRVLDTFLAASLSTSGVTRLITANESDFRVFGVFEFLVPVKTGDRVEQQD